MPLLPFLIHLFFQEVPMARDLAPAIALIRQSEGSSRKTYYDANGALTVGIGHKVLPEDNIKPGDTISEEREDALFDSDIQKNAAWLEDDLDGIDVNNNQFCALLSLEYNIGEGRFEDSTLLEDLANGDFDKAAQQFPLWRMAGGKVQPGLVRRRKAEQTLFLTPVSPQQ